TPPPHALLQDAAPRDPPAPRLSPRSSPDTLSRWLVSRAILPRGPFRLSRRRGEHLDLAARLRGGRTRRCTGIARMLVVDDAPAWRALYRMAFEGQFEIFEATDGQEGLAVFDSVKPDVIVLDLRMPKMDGLDFIRRLGHKGVHAPIVVCSGTLTDGERPAIPGVQLTPKTPDLRALST